jgi:uncharacterized protein
VPTIQTVAELEALYDAIVPAAITKELDYLTPLHREYVAASPFVLIATSGPDGLDCSPRGDPPGFVRVVDERTLMMPDRRGNNRLDSLRNIVVDGRVGLLFLVPGVGTTLRVNGTAELSTDLELRKSFAMDDKLPATVNTQCPKALIRSHLWDAARHRGASELPTSGQIMDLITNGEFDGKTYDANYAERVRQTIY